MKKYTWIFSFLLLALFACEDDTVVFEASTEGLEISFAPVAGGAMMHYTLPNDREIFAVNIRYSDSQGQEVLKVGDYGGDSLLLDGFTQEQEVCARISFVNHRNEESVAQEYSFSTFDSAPWAFFKEIEVNSSWDGFQVIYQAPKVVTGMAHVFYLGDNPLTGQKDTIPVRSFPIRGGGDTLNFVLQQEYMKNTVVVRTEDFQGYRVKQEIFPDIDAFRTEQWTVMADNFNDFGISIEDYRAKTGKKYLFDGEVKGKERMQKYLVTTGLDNKEGGVDVYGTYLAGPRIPEKPLVLDLGEQKTPAKLRLYAIIPLHANHAAGVDRMLGYIWQGWYDDKLPCKLTVYGNRETGDPDAGGWERLGTLNQNPKATTEKEKWSYPIIYGENLDKPKTMEQFEFKDPLFVDIPFPAVDNVYRYLKIVVHELFQTSYLGISSNSEQYLTLHELEVFVKKN